MTLSEQYHSGVITPREFVESVWNIVVIQQGFPGRWEYVLSALYGQMIFRTESEAESAASAFTLKRLEEIRQVKEEIALVLSYITGQQKALDMPYELPTPRQRFIDHIAIFQRILAREQSALAELSRGVRPEVL